MAIIIYLMGVSLFSTYYPQFEFILFFSIYLMILYVLPSFFEFFRGRITSFNLSALGLITFIILAICSIFFIIYQFHVLNSEILNGKNFINSPDLIVPNFMILFLLIASLSFFFWGILGFLRNCVKLWKLRKGECFTDEDFSVTGKIIPKGVTLIGNLSILLGLLGIFAGFSLLLYGLISGIILIIFGIFLVFLGIGCFMPWLWVWWAGAILSGIFTLLLSIISLIVLIGTILSANLVVFISVLVPTIIALIIIGNIFRYLLNLHVKTYFQKK